MQKLVTSEEAVANSLDILITILVHKYNLNQSNWFISSEWSQNLLIKVSLIKVCIGESSVNGQLFCWHQHWGNVHIMLITWKWDLGQWCITAYTVTHTERHKCDKTYFLVANFGFIHLIKLISWYMTMAVSHHTCDPKWCLICPWNFQLPPWILIPRNHPGGDSYSLCHCSD